MSNWPFGPSPAFTQRIGGTNQNLASVTSGASAWGAWTSLGGSLTHEAHEILVFARTDISIGLPFYLSLAVGSGADANMVVDGLYGAVPISPQWDETSVWRVPVRVPAGQTIFAKTAATSAVAQTVAVVGISAGFGRPTGFARAEALSLNLSTITPPAFAADTGGGTMWVEYVASTPQRYRALAAQFDMRAGVFSDRRFSCRVGIGASGSETLLIADQFFSKNSATASFGSAGFLPCDIASGSRLWVALQANAAASPGVHLMGLVA